MFVPCYNYIERKIAYYGCCYPLASPTIREGEAIPSQCFILNKYFMEYLCLTYFQAWKNQKLLTRKRNSELKVAQRKTGNDTPPPPLTEREKK